MVEYPWKSKSCRNLRFKILPPPNMWLRESSPMLSQSWRHHTYYVLLQSCNFLSVCYPRHDQGRVLVYQNSVPSIGNGNWRCTHRSFMERKEREEWEEEREKNLLWLSFVGVRWFYTMALIWQLGESPLRGVVKWIACGWLSTRREEKGTRWDGWMAAPTGETSVWASSGNWWWTGRPGVLQSMGSQSQTWLSDCTELK